MFLSGPDRLWGFHGHVLAALRLRDVPLGNPSRRAGPAVSLLAFLPRG